MDRKGPGKNDFQTGASKVIFGLVHHSQQGWI